MAIKQEFKIGDTVAYSAKFLRSIGDLSKKSADKRGTILEIIGDDDFKLAYIEGDFGCRVNVKNLSLVKNKMVLDHD